MTRSVPRANLTAGWSMPGLSSTLPPISSKTDPAPWWSPQTAVDIQPAPHGDTYSYSVEKFWLVVAMRPDNTVVVRTRKGKQHTMAASDPNLRRAHWWERLLFWHRIPPRTPSG
jgi:hypothetical protein